LKIILVPAIPQEEEMKKYLDFGSTFVIVLTFVLFVVALFVKGLTQDLLIEAGVLLVSIKIIMMSYKNNLYIKTVFKELEEIKVLLQKDA